MAALFVNKWKTPISLVITSGYFVFDTQRMKYRKEAEICVKYKGKPIGGVLGDVPCVSPFLQEIIDDVKANLNLPIHKKKKLNYYTTPFAKPKINGFYSSFTSIDVFLPDYFNISSTEQLTALAIHNLLTLMGEDVDKLDKDDWLTPDGKSLLSSFLLTPRAKKFVVAQASYCNLNSEYHLKYVIYLVVVLMFLTCFVLIDEKAKGTFLAKLGFLSFMAIPIFILRHLVSNNTYLICESKGVAQAISRNQLNYKELFKNPDLSTIDEEMLLGAIEYYSKLLQRKMAADRLFDSGFTMPSIVGGEGEDIGFWNLELPKRELITQLQKIKAQIEEERKIVNSSNDKQTTID